MAHTYMTFDFGTDEDKAQQARHKIEGWRQAFRLDKKLTYKFERPESSSVEKSEPVEAKPAKSDAAKAGKTSKSGKTAKRGSTENQKEKVETEKPESQAGPVRLLVRLAFSGHEKMTEERWINRIPAEEPFREASPQIVNSAEQGFAEIEDKFESLEG